MSPTIEIPHTALVVADLQRGVVEGMSGDSDALLDAAGTALEASRSAGIMTIHVRVAFRPGHPEVSPWNKAFRGLIGTGFMLDGNPEAGFHEAVAPRPGEVIVTKHRVGAFHATDLDQVLRSKGIEHLVLSGYATSGVILSTVRDASDRDYQLSVLSDGVADDDPVLHRVLLETVFPRQADVIDTAGYVAAIRGPRT